MSLYGDYVWQTRGLRTIEGIHGFATYLINENECYIEDVYVEESQRHLGIGRKMIDDVRKIAKTMGVKILTTSVNGRFKDPDTSLKACLAYGFKLSKVVDDIIFLRMEI